MYLPDLTEIVGFPGVSVVFSVGYLESGHEYSRGEVIDEVIDKIWALCKTPAIQTKGFHVCDLCSDRMFGLEVCRGTEKQVLGSADILVRGKEHPYNAPDLIYHYIVVHGYLPPDEFLQAVIDTE